MIVCVRFSYQLLPEHPLDELLSTLELLDRLGFWACYGADETYHKGSTRSKATFGLAASTTYS
jgi:hypothetical protein